MPWAAFATRLSTRSTGFARIEPGRRHANGKSTVIPNVCRLGRHRPDHGLLPEPEGSRTAAIKQLPGDPVSARPIDVTCRTHLEAAGALWRLTLTVEWGKVGDPTTSSVMTTDLRGDGTPTVFAGFTKPLP